MFGIELFFSNTLFGKRVYSYFLKEHPKVLEYWKIHPKNFDFNKFQKKYFTVDYIQDISANPSSNVTNKSIARFKVEMITPFIKYLTFSTLFEKMVEMYGINEATEYSKMLLDGTFYLHDTAAYIMPYCLGVDFSKLLLEGMPYGQLHSLPPKKPRTFINQVKEAVVELSSEFAGAVAFPSLIVLYTYVYLKYYGKDCKIDKKEVENDFQNLVHTLNKEMRNGIESSFTNISFFDKYILDELLTYIYSYFTNEIGDKELFLKKIQEVQKIVMEFLCKGDPITKAPYRFPVITCLSGDTDIFIYDITEKNLKKDKLDNIFGELPLGWSSLPSKYQVFNQEGKLVNLLKVYKGKAEKKVLKILFRNGYSLKVTKEHKFVTEEGLKYAYELKRGDKVLFLDKKFNFEGNLKELFVPDYLDEPFIEGIFVSSKNKIYEKCGVSANCFWQWQIKRRFPYYVVKLAGYTKEDLRGYRVKEKLDKKSIPTFIKIDEDFGKLLGFYLAEGHITKESEVGFSFNIDEQKYIEFIKNYLENTLGLRCIIRFFENTKGCQVITYSKTLAKLLFKLCGKGAKEKRLSSIVFNFPQNVLKSLIKAWIDGDGTIYYAEKGNPQIKGFTCNKGLAYDLQAIAKLIGINSTVRKYKNDRSFTKKENAFLYCFIVDRKDNSKLQVKNTKKLKPEIFKGEGYIEIENIEEVNYSGFVYDLWVDTKEHLYALPSGIISHNCNFIKDKKTGKILDKEFLDLVAKNNTKGQMNIYVSDDARKYSMCCRVLNDIAAFKFDSFGNGGVNVGSCRVLTINLNRIALEVLEPIEEKDFVVEYRTFYLQKLEERMSIAKKILDSFRECIRDFIKQGCYRFFNLGWFDLDKHFYSTIGFIGLYEALRTLDEDLRSSFAIDILETMDDMITEFNKNGKIKYNLEQVPGESAAGLLPSLDKYFYGEEKVPYILYSNQFVPLYERHSILDKIEIEGRYFKYLSGGGISHINILHEMKPEEVKFLIELCVEKGIEHFALNPVYSICENGHYLLGKYDECYICGAKIKDHLTRVVGFFTPVSAWSKQRREWEFSRRVWNTLKGDIESEKK